MFGVETEAPALLTGRAFSLEQVIEFQREFKRTGKFQPLGRLMTVIFERLEGEKCPPEGTDIWGRSLEFGDSGPMIGLSADHLHLIVTNNFPLTLPDTPDPANPTERLKQRYADRSDKHLSGSEFVIFEPIYQLLADPISIQLPGTGGAQPPLIATFRADSFGNYPALLIHQQTGEGYICNGSWTWNQ